MKRIKDYKQYQIRGLVYDRSDINKLAMFPGESLQHYVVKSVLVWKLRHLKHDILTETEIPGCGLADVIDLNTSTQYEVEFSHSPKYQEAKRNLYKRLDVEVIIVKCHKLAIDVNEISKFLDDWIVPD